MIKSICVSVLFFVLSMQAHAQESRVRVHVFSQMRYTGESGAHAHARFRERLHRYRQSGQGLPVPNTVTALNAARPLEQADFSKVPVWPDVDYTVKAFKKVRDIQFLIDPNHGDMKRRSSWLFPDDGCFARAALMGQNLQKWNVARPMKLFIFGDLTVKTPNSPAGEVSWWYHVVPVVSVQGQPVILDPAINPNHPLKLREWVSTMTTDPAKIKVSVCLPTTYAPSGPCDGEDIDDRRATSDQLPYLSYEWSRLLELHRDPSRELGPNPPWETFFSALSTPRAAGF